MRKVCKIYQLSRKLYNKKIPILPSIIKFIIRVIFSCDLPYTANVHETVDFGHGALGVVLHKNCIIEEGTMLLQGVTLGGNMGKNKDGRTSPHIGKNVLICAGAQILGPVYIGDNSIIGANSVVITDIPSNTVAAGVPARIIKNIEAK